MKKYPWNDEESVGSYHFWNDGKEIVNDVKIPPLKQRLSHPRVGSHFQEVLKDCCLGIAMIMEYLEKEGDSRDKK